VTRLLRLGSLGSTSILYLNSGLTGAALGPRLPEIAHDLSLSARWLGLTLLGTSVGRIAANQVVAGLVDRYGATRVVRISVGAVSAATVLPGLAALTHLPGASGATLLFAAMLALGAVTVAYDVPMLTLGSEVERSRGKSTTPKLQRLFQTGLLAGSVTGALCAGRVALLVQLAGTAALCIALGLIAAPGLPPHAQRRKSAGAGVALLRGSSLLRSMWLVAFVNILVQNAVRDWSGLYFARDLQTSPVLDGLPWVAYTAGGFGALLAGPRLIDRFDSRFTLAACGLLAAAGTAVGALASSPWLATAGFLAVGVGNGNVNPLWASVAGRAMPASTGAAIAAARLRSDVSGVVARPFIGLVGDAASLRAAFGVVALLCLAIPAMARRIPDTHKEAHTRT
jgi:MFS family permease